MQYGAYEIHFLEFIYHAFAADCRGLLDKSTSGAGVVQPTDHYEGLSRIILSPESSKALFE